MIGLMQASHREQRPKECGDANRLRRPRHCHSQRPAWERAATFCGEIEGNRRAADPPAALA
jgi:hypothetical protein